MQRDVQADRHDKANSRYFAILQTRLKSQTPSYSYPYVYVVTVETIHDNIRIIYEQCNGINVSLIAKILTHGV
jgi:hypothetical protein